MEQHHHHHYHHYPHSILLPPKHESNDDDIITSSTNKKLASKIYCKTDSTYCLAIRDGMVVLARADPADTTQHWFKDEKYSAKVKDSDGFPSFALVNKATGLAMKHPLCARRHVQLIPYNPNLLDESVLWTQGPDLGLGDSYRSIRPVHNIGLNVDAFRGHERVHDGTTIVCWDWNGGKNQRWKLVVP